MSSSRRSAWRAGRATAALCAVVLGLAACNLRPLHGGSQGAELNDQLAAVEVTSQRNELGWQIRDALNDELGLTGKAWEPVYRLDVRLTRRSSSLAIQLDDTITRFNVTLLARYALTRKSDGVVLYQSADRRVASYNVVRQPYATYVAETDAERRALAELARTIRAKLALYFAGVERIAVEPPPPEFLDSETIAPEGLPAPAPQTGAPVPPADEDPANPAPDGDP